MKKVTLVLVAHGHLGGKSLFSHRVALTVLFLIIGMAVETEATADCGHPVISQRVVGGRDSALGDWPWMCSLCYGKSHVCGATLVNNLYVLTAAHCFMNRDRSKFSVKMGMVNLTNPGRTQAVYNVVAVDIPPFFQNNGDSGDMALLKLNASVNFTNNIRPICLPSPGQLFSPGMMCTVTGWGNTADGVKLPQPFTMQEVQLPLINSSVCDQLFAKKFNQSYQGQVHSDMICAGYPDQRKDACQGDSGGPLACKINSTWYLTGIVSWGIGCATEGIAGVYTYVPDFIPWITKQMNVNSSTTTGSSNTSSTSNDTRTFKIETINATNPSKISEDTTTADGHNPHMPMISFVVFALLVAKILEMM